MAWNSRRNHQSARIDGRDYWLIPKGEASDASSLQVKSHMLLKYNELDYPEYKYESLPQDKKRIRLLKLYSGEVLGREIFCELIEVEYDRQFHIPISIDKGEAKTDKNSGDNSRSDDPCLPEDEQTDLEVRWENRKREAKLAREGEGPTEREARIKRQAVREVQKIVDDKNNTEEVRDRKEKEAKKKRTKQWKEVKDKEVKYEALSWCWGKDEEEYAVLIKKNGNVYKKRVRKELALALKYLRRAGRKRVLWIDAICINQANPNERNHQVQMMSRVYTRARKVCIWLGESDTDSEIAIRFIKNEMMELKHFDTITTDEQYSRKWQALMSLMQRDWFFRRWVVQEIAMARTAKVYCGPHSVPWKSFAVAVELFVEVETATHRLSEVMKRDVKFRHVPGWFEYVSELGASLLVQATGKVFRTKRTPMQQEIDTSDDEREETNQKRKMIEKEDFREQKKRVQQTHTIDPLERRSLLSLEYLVSTMFIFETSEPRDAAYALLAIARDASPFAPAHFGQEDQKLFLVMTLLDRFLAEKPFVVDYTRPYSDVSRDFVEFSIARTQKTDPQQALDILCRPWALEPPKKLSNRLMDKSREERGTTRRLLPERKSWKIRKLQKEGNEEANSQEPKYKWTWVKDPRSNREYYKDFAKRIAWESCCIKQDCAHEDASECILGEWKPKDDWDKFQARYFPKNPSCNEKDISLPSWIAPASKAPFMLDHAPGMDMRKTSRANADPLVGPPQDGRRNYNAAGPEKLNLDVLKFRKRPVLGHYSLYVKGFELDEVVHVEDASQLGSIPRAWMALAEWADFDKDPPDEFWRTIVADRGRDNRNPPYYYARACQESVHKGNRLGGSVDTTALINNEQNSIIAEFCRRVHAVIWNRSLFKTKGKRLGLASNVREGDKVCILYGCTVPVILRQTKKARNETKREDEEDRIELLKACIKRAISNRERKGKYKSKKKEYMENETWTAMMDARQAYLEERRNEKNGKYEEHAMKEKQKDWKVFCEQQAEELRKVDIKMNEAQDQLNAEANRNRQSEVDSQKGAETDRESEENSDEEETDEENWDQKGNDDDESDDEQSQKRGDEIEEKGQDIDNNEDRQKTAAPDEDTAEKIIEKAKKQREKIEETIKKRAVEKERSNAPATPETRDDREDFEVAPEAPEAQKATDEDANNVKEATQPEVPRDYWYEFMGECYLHGMMDGEAMREKFYKDLQEWVFELR